MKTKTQAQPTLDVGALVEEGRQLEQERLAYQKEVDAKIAKMVADEKVIEDKLIAYCEANKLGEIGVDGGPKATFHKAAIPIADTESGGWDAIYKHIRKTGEFDLLEKRLGKVAYRERLADKKRVPGIATMWKKSISYSKGKGS